MVQTPVLFETFARPDYARQVWDAIKASKPRSLYFYSNKARSDKPDEIKRNEEVRSFIQEIDWDCELHTWFREEYVDVYTSLKGAVDWVCENEEAWIALEEDVVPTPAFFSFCDQMIDYYRDDMRVWNVSGDNFLNINPGGYDYIFSQYHWMYGWATWRNRWLSIDWNNINIDQSIEEGVFDRLFKTRGQRIRIKKALSYKKDFIETTKCWDFVFGLVCDQKGAVEVVPSCHLVTNIGVSGEHHKNAKRSIYNIEGFYKEEFYQITRRPPKVEADKKYDYLLFKAVYVNNKPLLKRIALLVSKLFRIDKVYKRII